MLSSRIAIPASLLTVLCCLSTARGIPSMSGVGFSPFMDGQGPGTVIPEDQIRDRLSFVAKYTASIRGWGSRDGLDRVPDIAKEFGLPVAQCAYLSGDPTANKQEKDNLVAAAIRSGNVDWAIVGSEALVGSLVSEGDLIQHLDDVRAALNAAGLQDLPVTTAEPFGNWANQQEGGLFHRHDGDLVHKEVFDHIDRLFVNLYPFHEGVAVTDAIDKLSSMYEEVVAAVSEVVPDLPVIIGETGWPSCGDTNGAAVPSLVNEEKYFWNVAVWSRKHDVPAFWFEAFDENWKPDGYARVEKHWGLHYTDGQPKFSAILGDVNRDYATNALDIASFIEVLTTHAYRGQADCNLDGAINALDINPFIHIVLGADPGQVPVPEPVAASCLLLSLGIITCRRR